MLETAFVHGSIPRAASRGWKRSEKPADAWNDTLIVDAVLDEGGGGLLEVVGAM
jgi:hypothetical protein